MVFALSAKFKWFGIRGAVEWWWDAGRAFDDESNL
jgi:hypothetical protein